MKIVYMGTPDFAVKPLENIIKKYDVCLVVSQPDKRVGRKQVLTNTPVKEVALKNNIDVFQPESIKKDYQKILDYQPDIIITCAYGQIIPKELLEYPKYGCINIHASLLPKLRGGAPIHRAIIEGYKETGITIMYMDEAMDSGDIIKQETVTIEDDDTLETLHDKLMDVGANLIMDSIPEILDRKNNRIKQNIDEVTYAYNIKREEEHLDFNLTSKEIYNKIRGLSPSPSANFILDNEEFKVYSSKISDNTYDDKENGEIVQIYKDGIGVKTKDSEIILLEIKPFGKKKMKVLDYLNGTNKDDLIGKVLK